jgi:hypothetical protein
MSILATHNAIATQATSACPRMIRLIQVLHKKINVSVKPVNSDMKLLETFLFFLIFEAILLGAMGICLTIRTSETKNKSILKYPVGEKWHKSSYSCFPSSHAALWTGTRTQDGAILADIGLLVLQSFQTQRPVITVALLTLACWYCNPFRRSGR